MKTLRNSEAKTIPSRTTVGLDVGDRHSWFCILDEAGEVVAEGRVRTTSEALNEHFTRWARSRVVLEAGISSAWISRLAMLPMPWAAKRWFASCVADSIG